MFEGLQDRLEGIFHKIKGYGKITEDNIEEMVREVRLALLEADVNYKVVKEFTNNVKEKALGEEVANSLKPGEVFVKIVNDELVELLGGESAPLNTSGNPAITMMVGLQGSGKTTTCGKLALFLRKKHAKKPLLVACDIYRPAAIDQLITIGKELNIPVYEEGKKDPVEIANNAINYAKENKFDYVLIDTAGRLHIDEPLMEELNNIKDKVKPQEILLVIDAMMGQDAINVITGFNDKLKLTGVILTKLDGDTRGGVALSVRHLTNVPIKFIGVSEKMDGLDFFDPHRMADRILGMGDVMTLVEKAQEEMDEKEARKAANKMMSGKFDLNDMLDNMKKVQKMGSLGGLIKLIPGMPKISPEQQAAAEKEMKNFEVIINSMTPYERSNPDVFKFSRKQRVANGCGKTLADVNKVLKKYEQMKQMMKQMESYRKSGRMPPGGLGGLGGMGGFPPM